MYSSFARPPVTSGNHEEAWELNVGQMAHLLNGTLILSSTPPVGGKLEPIGRVVPGFESYLGGDLVVMEEDSRLGCFLEEPMLHGATGIVASRPITPWPGCYQILVRHVGDAVQRLAEYRRHQFRGKVIAVMTKDQTTNPQWQWIRCRPGQHTAWIWVQADQPVDLNWCDPDEIIEDFSEACH